MTNQEAIDLLCRNKSVFQYDTEMCKAIDLAIKALQESNLILCENNKHIILGTSENG